MKTSFFVLTCLLASSNSYAGKLESCDQPNVHCDSSKGCSTTINGNVYGGERIQNWCRFITLPYNASPGSPTPFNNGDRGFPKANSTKINKSF